MRRHKQVNRSFVYNCIICLYNGIKNIIYSKRVNNIVKHFNTTRMFVFWHNRVKIEQIKIKCIKNILHNNVVVSDRQQLHVCNDNLKIIST